MVEIVQDVAQAGEGACVLLRHGGGGREKKIGEEE
jgi:hypothetical protein